MVLLVERATTAPPAEGVGFGVGFTAKEGVSCVSLGIFKGRMSCDAAEERQNDLLSQPQNFAIEITKYGRDWRLRGT